MKAALILALLLLCGCATSYQSDGLTGGYTETQLTPDTFRVNFRGNAYTSSERALDMAMLRAAELTLLHGFTHFQIIDERNTTRASTWGQTYYSGRLTTYHNHTIYKPKSGILVQLFKEKPEGFAYDAAFLQQSLKRTYNLP